ncbi:MAG: S41 family peptidase [Saprospiraceae bacterium]
MSYSQNKKPINIWLPFLLAAVLAFGMSIGFALRPAQSVVAKGNQPAKHLEELIRYIDAKYVDEVDSDELAEKAIKSILKELDPHSNYISPEQIAAVNEELDGNFEGVGIQFIIQDDTIYIVDAIPEGPARAAGVRAGDKMIMIEDSMVAGIGLKSEDVIKRLKGEKNTTVNIKIKRAGQKDLLPFSITRDRIPIYSVDAGYMLNDETGYIKVNRFSATTSQEFVSKLDEFEKEGMKDLVIDLRQNPGGYLNAATSILNQLFGDKKLLVYTEGTHYNKNEYKSSGRNFHKIEDIVLLIDEGSASASEILAGAIQDWDRGTIIGRRSFGKGLVQEQYDLSNGGALRLTVARYYTPSGRSIQKPYTEGRSSYNDETYDRFKSGELSSQDSIHIGDTTKYYTSKNRVVYGGGGITPDVFIPIDKLIDNGYYAESVGYVAPYVYHHLDKHRANYKKYKTIKAFSENVTISDKMLNDFAKYAKSEGVKMVQGDFEKAKKELALLIKANIARQFFGTEGFFQMLNEDDVMIKEALKALK